MTKLYFGTLCLFLLSSCSFRLKTQGIADKTTNYVVTKDGKQINSNNITLQPDKTVLVDTTHIPLTQLSAAKKGGAYWGIKDGEFYDGLYYGKIIALRRYFGTEVTRYNNGRTNSRALYDYYLQKKGQAEIVAFTNKNLINYVQDNPLALRKAKAARIYSTITWVSFFTTISGLACVFLPYESPIRKPATTMGVFSMPAFLISMPLSNGKKIGAIKTYNR